MRIIFSEHAIKRMYERDINKETVRFVLEDPDYSSQRFRKEIEALKWMNGKRLKVVYVQKENYIKIITVYWV